jgi:hypothetical protein
MKTKIASVFYDKEVEVLSASESMDAEGGVIYKGLDVVDTFKGNVNFSNCKKIQEEYGLDYQIDISITTDYDLLEINDIIKYQEIIYNVTDILPSDSHLLVVATKWRQ